ncbi:IS200/IS605 family transposase [Sporolactobacillus shoreicorticis]|uniref:IS200/IS605 family transposase n=1 Tax=Sporolactobacillus shoreicorticis TaxID=1923877 RepID=A0ABW5S504_9BACL|nr:IS200/IS605 family transposase [Sporolactobacillus shoreicorticis]MCO7127357.1 IS200/IS605 family transposase [Sporolactobacillus shoreicorticis]
MDSYQESGHAVYAIKYHVIWVTKYRDQVLQGSIAIRLRELIRQGCEARGVTILQRSVGKEFIHLLISSPPSLVPSKIMQYLKGCLSRLLQDEFSELKKRYWDQHLWSRGYFCATIGNVTEEIIRNYIANQSNKIKDDKFKIDD